MKIRLFWATVAAVLLTDLPAAAQQMPTIITPPEVTTDPNDLNLMTGKVKVQRPTISIPAAPRLSFSRASDFIFYVEGQRHIGTKKGLFNVHIGADRSENFECADSNCTGGNSASIFSTTAMGTSNLTNEKSGERYSFGIIAYKSTNPTTNIQTTEAYAGSVAYPDGEVLGITYQVYDSTQYSSMRVKRVTSNTGYYLELDYEDLPGGDWLHVKTAAIYASANPGTPLARLDYSLDGNQVTDALGRTWQCSLGCGQYAFTSPWKTSDSIVLPGEGSPALLYASHPTNSFLTQAITRDGIGWTYSYTGVASQVVVGALKSYKYDSVQITGPDGYTRIYGIQTLDRGSGASIRYEIQYVKSSKDELNRTTDFAYTAYSKSHRLTGITYPEGNSANFDYDARNNIIKRTDKAKTGTDTIIQEAGFNIAGCSGAMCWRPDWYRDGRGQQTDYLYNAKGQLTEQTDPPDPVGVRRKTYVEYEIAPGGLSRQKVIRKCGYHPINPALMTCGTSAEERTEYDHLGNTALPTAERRMGLVPDPANPGGPWISQTRQTTFAYYPGGRLLSADGPLPGTDDTRFFCYDAGGRQIQEIGERSPAGIHIVKRTTYRAADDKVIAVEIGTTTSPVCTPPTVFERSDTAYDTRRNPIRDSHSDGTTVHTVTDRKFLNRGLLECSTVRMNLASLPALDTACTLGTAGSDGPDRITKNLYDVAGQLLQVREAVGVSGQEATEATFTYTANGKRQDVIDGEGNRARFTYDGFDRVLCWVFPSKTKAAAFNDSSPATAVATAGALGGDCAAQTGDFERYHYDANGNRTSLRKRDTKLIGYSFDNLNRMSAKDLPGTEPDVAYTYDVMGRQLTASFTGTGQGITNVYNGFGDAVSSSSNVGGTPRALTNRYDLAGNRTRITHPDGKYFETSYDALSRTTAATLTNASGTTGFMAINYEPTGRRTNMNRASSWTAYGYDGIGRLAWLPQIFVPASGNVTQTFAYTPASQVGTETRDNDAYAWTGHGNGSTATVVNGLNQIATKAGTPFLYDPNGNLTNDGATAFTYDSENRLLSAAGAKNATLTYDPLGRLSSLTSGSAVMRFIHDGDHLALEYADSTGAMTKRYYFGAGADEPVLEDYGDLLACTNGTRFLHPDARGSIIARADCWGARTDINAFDEYGVPAAANAGRFQYTGQAWLPELGLYYYKARMYRPGDGLFMQTDPIGYDDQWNLYAYVGLDPVNQTDPSGQAGRDRDGDTGWILGSWIELAVGVYFAETPQQRNFALDRFDDRMRVLAPDLPHKGGRSGRQNRLKELGTDKKLGRLDRGWIKQEQNAIERGKRPAIRNPPGKELAHERGREAAKGYDYKHSKLQDRDLHKTQHKFDDQGRRNRERPLKGPIDDDL